MEFIEWKMTWMYLVLCIIQDLVEGLLWQISKRITHLKVGIHFVKQIEIRMWLSITSSALRQCVLLKGMLNVWNVNEFFIWKDEVSSLHQAEYLRNDFKFKRWNVGQNEIAYTIVVFYQKLNVEFQEVLLPFLSNAPWRLFHTKYDMWLL